MLNMNFSSFKKIWENLKKEIIIKGINLGRGGEIVLGCGVLFSALCSQTMISWILVALLLLFEAMIRIRKKKE